MPGHLKHLQGEPGSVGVVVVLDLDLNLDGVLLLALLLLVPEWLQQLTLSLRPSMRSDDASSCQRAIVAWR